MTRQCFVAGFPISHSRSPAIHGFWIAEQGLDARYSAIEVKPEQLPALLQRVREGEFVGGNLTIPLKQAAVPLLDQITPEAGAMGAVNTIWMEDGRLCGANTDVPGFFAHLDESAPGWDRAAPEVLVLGAGGAARAIVYGLLRRKVSRIIIANRSLERAQALIRSLAGPGLPPADAIAGLPDAALVARCGLVINTTSLGMKGQPPLTLDWPARLDGVVVNDIVYAPLETELLAGARARGALGVDGLGMLLHQAALAFGRWFGAVPAVSPALRALIEADLAPKAAARP
ncbi:MAG: shikimate dehydrogenase [Bosea sp.]|nr:shikimate dehydrogenase [Bosea sp. (in: a-proteobacteria)]